MRSGAAACKTSTCKYFENLAFLQDKIANRDTVSNVKLGLGSTADSSLLPEQPVVTIKDEETPSVKKRKHWTVLYVLMKKDRARKASDQVDTMLLKALKDLDKPTTQEMPEAKSAESDSDTLFCQSLIPTLKSLGTKENMKAKVQIQQLLFTLKFPDSEE
ncbi:transcription factor Adf-1-like [Paramuricea clavata]|uniref:Transcription factor Adf-1-like n=1 Tax=Paramuricea clavata TaxID=317549 RepID=A0A7D9K205_PARCT|nr:transcription factor Adf-1-like [Paramuricea clavata]